MNTPKIRFKGFKDDWEQRKLGELCNITTGKLDANAMVSDGQYDFYTSGIDVFKIDVAAFEGPAITIAGNGASVGYMHLADGKFNAYQRTYVLTDFLADRQFLNVAIGNELPNKIQEEVRGSGIPYIVLNMLTDLAIPFPSHEEQYAIGVYFQQLDHLITLHQRKCDETKELKKFMLQKLFPKNGQKNPEIRFEGFTDDWEQCKLGDVCSRVQGNDGRMELPTLTISAGNGWMRQEDRFSGNIAGKEQKNYTLLRKGELSYNHGNSKLAKYGTVFSLQTYEEALVPRVYHSFKVKEGNCDFVEYYFATKLPDRELSKLISSGARMDGLLNIGYDEFMGIQMKFPSTLEQRKISLYFRKLDHLITLHQRKCEKLKELKKFMLQNMFV